MRRFEFVGDGSEKFWEIEREGAAVTVRFGRIGTNGQTQTKDLGTEAAAVTHVDKLVAEKVKKGYVEGAGAVTGAPKPPPPPPPPAPASGAPDAQEAPDAPDAPVPPDPAPRRSAGPGDETTFTMPPAWVRQAEPFRGRRPAPTIELDPAATRAKADDLRRRTDANVRRLLDHPSSDAELVRRANLHLGTSTGFLRRAKQQDDPLGAAVLTSVLARGLGWSEQGEAAVLADDLFVRHGAVFAAEAVACSASVTTASSRGVGRAPGVQFEQWLRPAPPGEVNTHALEPILRRTRAHLAGVDDETYRAVVGRLADLRQGPLVVRLVTSYLAPTEQAWVDDDVVALSQAGAHQWPMLLASATTVPQVTEILATTSSWSVANSPELLYSITANLGPDALSALAGLFDKDVDAASKKRLLNLIGILPTDAAFDALVDRIDQKYVSPAIIDAMGRYPERAMRLLSSRATGSDAKARRSKELLRGHVVSNPELAARLREVLGGDATRAIDAVGRAATAVPVAGPDDLPSVLVTPPWRRRTRASKPVVIGGLAPPRGFSLAWKPGEREEWAQLPVHPYWPQNLGNDWKAIVKHAVDRSSRFYGSLEILAAAPPDLVRPHLAGFAPEYVWDALPALRRILAGVGEAALEFTYRVVLVRPTTLAPALLPVEGAEVAARMAGWLARTKSLRPVARTWLERHPHSAATGIVPIALGKPGKDRTAAEAALRLLDQAGHREAILRAAGTYGGEVHDAIAAALDVDPLEQLPAKLPTLPSWLDPAHLPTVLLRGRRHALAPEAVGTICTMFSLCKPGETYAGVDHAKEATDPASLAEMAWGLLERWEAAGYPSKESWVLEALALAGDDETVRRLAPMIRSWPGEGAHARAVAGLDVLSAIGSDVALMHLHGIAEKAKFKALKTKAREKMDEVADSLGLSTEQLADRLVPDFGLDDHGSMVLDYGPRRFTVAFDEQLKPVVADEDGSRRKVLPKPSAKDDPELASAAYADFSGLKKDVKVIATDQIRRFERAMVLGRRWTAQEQRTLFVEHPLLWHLTRRLVWATFDAAGAVTGSFRVAEDRTLAGVSDDEVAVPEEALVGIAHPLHLGGHLAPWSEVFADYEILQPFPQLGRDVWQLTPAERTAKVLTRMAGVTIDTGRILGLSHRGWERGPVLDGGVSGVVLKPVAGGHVIVIDLDPGIIAGSAMEWKEQKITGVWVNDGPADWGNAGGNRPFSVLDDISASELIRDLEHLRG